MKTKENQVFLFLIELKYYIASCYYGGIMGI